VWFVSPLDQCSLWLAELQHTGPFPSLGHAGFHLSRELSQADMFILPKTFLPSPLALVTSSYCLNFSNLPQEGFSYSSAQIYSQNHVFLPLCNYKLFYAHYA
jgi:hypothetical protein